MHILYAYICKCYVNIIMNFSVGENEIDSWRSKPLIKNFLRLWLPCVMAHEPSASEYMGNYLVFLFCFISVVCFLFVL